MANRVASVAGNWTDAATWGGSAPPGNGDTATINVAVVLNADVTVGASGANDSIAVDISSTGKLTFATNVKLTCRGRLRYEGVDAPNDIRLDMVAGSHLYFDTSAAAGGVRYGIQPSGGAYTRPMLRARGASGNPAIISSNVTGGLLRSYAVDAGAVGQGCIDAERLDFVNFGDNSEYYAAWLIWPGHPGHVTRMDHVNFTGGGAVICGQALLGDSHFEFDYVRFSGTLYTIPLYLYCTSAKTTGTRQITNSSFDKSPSLYGPADFAFNRCVFEDRWNSQAYKWAYMASCFIQDKNDDAFSICGNLSDSYYLKNGSGGNPHGFNVGNLDENVTIQNVIIQSVNGTGGDFVFPHSPASLRTFTALNCIMLPKRGTYATPGKFISLLGGPNSKVRVKHCTIAVSDDPESGLQYGETYPGHGGIFDEIYSNIFWRPTAGSGGYKVIRIAGTVQDGVLASKADYNLGWNLAEGSDGDGFHCQNTATPMFSSGTPGVHDISGDPQFVDSARNVEKWAIDVLGSAAATDAERRAEAIAAMRADPGKIDQLIAWVNEGYAPRNPDLDGAAQDAGAPITAAGGTIGAVAMSDLPPDGGGEEEPGEPAGQLFGHDTFSTGALDDDINTRVGEFNATWTRSAIYVYEPVQTNNFRMTGDGSTFYRGGGYRGALYLMSAVPIGDYDIETDWEFLSDMSDNAYGVVFKSHDTDKFHWRLQYQTYWHRWSLGLQVADGTFYIEATFDDNPPPGSERSTKIKVRATNPRIEVEIDGVSRLSSNSATEPGSRVGLWGEATTNTTETTGIHFGRFTVGEPNFALPGYSVAGPESGPPDFDSDVFVVALAEGVNPGSVVITPHVDGLAGEFTPATVTLTNADRSKTFIYRPEIVSGGSAPSYGGKPTIPGLTAIQPVIVASRKGGTVPCVVQLSAAYTTATGTVKAYEELEYEWEITDANGDPVFTNPVMNDDGTFNTVHANSDQFGPECTVLIENPGDVFVKLKARGHNGTGFVTAETTSIKTIETVQVKAKGGATSGNFTMTRPSNGQVSAPVNLTDTDDQITTKLEAIYGAGNVEMLGSHTALTTPNHGGVLNMSLIGALLGTTEAIPTISASLVGGSSPGILVGRVQVGETVDRLVATAYTGTMRYFDPVGGSDAASGVDAANAKQTWGALESWMEGGANRGFALKAGTTMTATSQLKFADDLGRNMLMTRYGSGANPKIVTTIASDAVIKWELGHAASAKNCVVYGIDIEAGANNTNGVFIQSSNNGDNTQLYGTAEHIYFINGSLKGGTVDRFQLYAYNNGFGIGLWNWKTDGEAYAGMECLISFHSWFSVVGGSFQGGGSNATLHQHIYPSGKRFMHIRWVNFIDAVNKNFCLNGNVTNISDGGADFKFVLVDGCDIKGPTNGLDFSATQNDFNQGRFYHVIVQNNRIHIGQVGTQYNGVYTTCVKELVVRDNKFYGNRNYDVVCSDPATELEAYRNLIWKPSNAMSPAFRIGGITNVSPATAYIYRNIIVSNIPGGGNQALVNIEGDEMTGKVFDWNTYWTPNGEANVFYDSDANSYRSLTFFKGLGQEANGQFFNPEWENPAAGDFSGGLVSVYDGGSGGGSGTTEGTISFTNNKSLTDAADMPYEAVYAPPVMETAWASNMAAYVAGFPYVAGSTNGAGESGYNLDQTEHYDTGEGFQNWARYTTKKGMSPNNFDSQIEAYMTRFRDRAVIADGIPHGAEEPGVTPYHRYLRGIANHYRATGNVRDITAATILAAPSGFPYPESAFEEINGHVGVQREIAFMLWTWLDWEWMGLGVHPQIDAAARTILKHIAQWTAVPQRAYVWLKPFMGALSARSLIAYWDRFRGSADAEKIAICEQIPEAVAALYDYIWDHCWYPAGVLANGWDKGAVFYQDVAGNDPRMVPLTGLAITSVIDARRIIQGPNSLVNQDDYYNNARISVDGTGDYHLVLDYTGANRRIEVSTTYPFQADVTTANTFTLSAHEFNADDGPGASPDLNHMIAPIGFWLYMVFRRHLDDFERSKKYRTRGLAMFNGCSHNYGLPDKQKSWNQSIAWSNYGLDWLEQGDSEWPLATALTLQAPATGLTGDPGVKSGPFLISIPYGRRLASPEVITATDGAGSGVFTSPAPIVTTDRPEALIAYTPDEVDAGESVIISTPGNTLTPGTTKTFNVTGEGEPEPDPVTSYLLSGPSSGNVGSNSANFTITLGSGLVTVPIRFVPQSSAGTGEFIPTFLDLTDSVRFGTFVYKATSPGPRIISAPDNGAIADDPTVSYTANSVVIPVTDYTFDGPSEGAVGVPSSDFTITLGVGTPSETIRFVLNDSSSLGVFVPTFLDLNNNVRSGTVKYTPATTGPRTISTSNNKGISNPSGKVYTSLSPGGGNQGPQGGDGTFLIAPGGNAYGLRIIIPYFPRS